MHYYVICTCQAIQQFRAISTSYYLNYYLSYDVCACFRVSVCLSECLSAKNFFSSKMDEICKFGEQTSRILEFKPEGLEV